MKILRKFMFYTTEGITFQPFLNEKYPDCPDVENCQILGWSNGYDSKEAFESLKLEYPYLLNSRFEEVISSELKNKKRDHFNLKK